MKKYYKIGETFTRYNVTYKAVLAKDNSCSGCALIRKNCPKLSLGPCGVGRPDNNNVIFIQVEP